MTLVFSLSVICFAIWMIAIQISYSNQAENDRYRYQYFALRDRLAMLAIDGKIDEKSPEYRSLIGVINFHIKAVETVSVLRIARLLAAYHSSSVDEQQVQLIIQNPDNEEVKQLMIDFLSVTVKLLKRNSRAQMAILSILKKLNLRSPSGEIRLEVSKPKAAIDNLQQSKTRLEGSLHHNFAVA